MYLLFNIIPLIFGNKQTIEFRIHTPTYEVNKILPFIFMNSLLVNFAIKYQESILKNKNFLNQFDLFSILSDQIDNYNISNRSGFRDLMYNYIEKRKSYCERQILKGDILGTESEIPSLNDINWLNTQNIKKISNPYTNLTNSNIYSYKKAKPIITDSINNFMTNLDNYVFDKSLIDSVINSESASWTNKGFISQIEKLDSQPKKLENDELPF